MTKRIATILVVIGISSCSSETPLIMSLTWTKYEPKVKSEPNYHFMLKGYDRDFCIVSISDVIFSERKPLHATLPATKPADIDCSFGGISYAIHPESHTFITVESVSASDSQHHFRLQARLTNDDKAEVASLYQTVSLRLNNE